MTATILRDGLATVELVSLWTAKNAFVRRDPPPDTRQTQPQKRNGGWQLLPSSHRRHHRRQGRATASSRQSPSIPFSRHMLRSCRVTSDPAIRSRTVLDRYEGQSRVLAVIITTSSGPIPHSYVP